MDLDAANFNGDDEKVWELFRCGNELAYSDLMNRYTRPMFNYGYRFCQDKDLLKDCIQEVFLELWRKRSRISPTGSVKWYLFKSIRLKIFRDQSKWQKNGPIEDDYDFMVEFNIETEWIQETSLLERSAKISRVLNELPARQREILFLRFYEGLNFEQIAALMGISRQSVHNLLQKAFRSFRTGWTIFFISPFLFYIADYK